MISESLGEHAEKWTTAKDDFLLVYTAVDAGTGNELASSAIFNKCDKTITVLEIDKVAQVVKRKMYEAGVPLVPLSDVRHLFE